jgi:hypothetical protein
MVWGIQGGRRQPHAACPVGGPPTGHRKVVILWESMATPFHTPMVHTKDVCLDTLSHLSTSDSLKIHESPSDELKNTYHLQTTEKYISSSDPRMGVWQLLAMDSLKFHPGPPYPILLHTVSRRPAPVFHPFRHPMPYAYAIGYGPTADELGVDLLHNAKVVLIEIKN